MQIPRFLFRRDARVKLAGRRSVDQNTKEAVFFDDAPIEKKGDGRFSSPADRQGERTPGMIIPAGPSPSTHRPARRSIRTICTKNCLFGCKSSNAKRAASEDVRRRLDGRLGQRCNLDRQGSIRSWRGGGAVHPAHYGVAADPEFIASPPLARTWKWTETPFDLNLLSGLWLRLNKDSKCDIG
ncbi:MAG: hypothetical protein ACU826_00685 [Gammaproteobacteria bacterium]